MKKQTLFTYCAYYTRLICFSLCLIGAGISVSEAQSHKNWVADIPIMDGLTIEPQLSFSFDAPSGRILVIYARAESAIGDVASYYQRVLTGLGWQSNDVDYQRGNETLAVTQVMVKNLSLWRFALTPTNQ